MAKLRATWAVSTLALAACGYQPGVGPGAPAPLTGAHQVGYLVRCGVCTAIYTTNDGTVRREVKGSWSTTVNVDPHRTSIVSLTVTSASQRDRVRSARIDLDGRKAAEASEDDGSTFGDDVHLTIHVGG